MNNENEKISLIEHRIHMQIMFYSALILSMVAEYWLIRLLFLALALYALIYRNQ